MATSNCLVTNILQNILFYVQQKKLIQVSNNFRDFLFWVNYPFKTNVQWFADPPKNENEAVFYSPSKYPRCMWLYSFRGIQSELYKKIVLAPPILSMGINGCLLDPVQKMWKKYLASVIKHPAHGSGGWIKALCSEAMRFWKINIHISNIINTFFLTSADCGKRKMLTSSELDLFIPMERIGGARTIFYLPPIGFIWKKHVTYTWDASEGSKTCLGELTL